MALEQRLSLKMSQRLVMTPGLQQAIRLLQLSKLELAEEISQEMVENPVLEEHDEIDARSEAASDAGLTQEGSEVEEGQSNETESDSWDEVEVDLLFRDAFESGGTAPNMHEQRELPSLENTAAVQEDLQDHLIWQLSMQFHDTKSVHVGKVIIWNLDDDGYLEATDEELLQALEELAAEDAGWAASGPYTQSDIERVRRRISRFDPVGVAARTLEECLLIQLEHLGLADSLAADLIREHLPLLRVHKMKEIADKLGCDEEQARELAEIVRGLNPKPGASCGAQRRMHVVPDVIVAKVDGEYVVMLNDDGLPRLKLSRVYKHLYEQYKAAGRGENPEGHDKKTKNYVRDKFRSAVWFMKSLEQRQNTIFRVAESIVKHQQGFLDSGVQALKPLVLRDVAEDVEMHESTVSRVVTNKYMHTPQGLFEMKFFFHSGLAGGDGSVSSVAVKEKIKQLIEGESPKKPLSDAAIVKMLKAQDVKIARRTVAKYRDELGIPASTLRKRT
ncbi:MAG: RNA polymerase factor sigma-54 [Acidobacteriota bacterium]